MFGDLGHGFMLFITGLFMVILGKNSKNSIFKAKYLVLLMGIFSMFCGLLYNDFFSFSLNLFGSCYGFGPSSTVIR